MSENNYCTSCKQNLNIFEFTFDNKIYSTCNICRNKKSEKRKKNTCDICGIRAIFNFDNNSYGIKCFTHKEIGMIDIKNPKCIVCKTKRSSFNYENESKATHCKECSLNGMIDIKNPKCIVCKTKYPSFNYENESKATHCKECSLDGMIDIKHPKCIICKIKRPTFNYENETKATHCKECSLDDMIDIKNYKCIVCKTKRSNFNYENESKPTHCKECSLDSMVNITNSKCEICNVIANFGYINQKSKRCSRHKLPLMFKNKKVKCLEKDCNEISEYGIESPIHCFIHKQEDDLCLLGQICIQCGRENELCNKKQICLTYCRPTEIHNVSKKFIKQKEALVLSYLDRTIISDSKPTDDRIIDNLCVKRRPDRIYDCGFYFLIIEIDENQHKSYTNDCFYSKDKQEIRRMVQIHEALSNGLMQVIFLRFNPDNFRIDGKLKKINMQKRLDVLHKWVLYCLNFKEFPIQSSIAIKYLFFDEYDENNKKFDIINNIKELL